jgi:hypothetical protein
MQLVFANGTSLRIETDALDAALVCSLVARYGVAPMSVVASGTRVWLAAGVTDTRKGFTGLSALVQNALASNPFCGHAFVFRGRHGDLVKLLWWDGTGLCLMAKRLERGRFIWRASAEWNCIANGGATLDAARRDRLATSAALGGAAGAGGAAPRV